MELKILNVEKSIKTKLQTPMPEYIIKEKPGQARASYVSGQSVIDKLNATFGYAGWSWDIQKSWIEQSCAKVIKSKWENGKKINLPEPIYEEQLPVAHVIGRLTVHLERPDGSIHTVSKSAPGAQPIIGGQSEQENCFKSAHTDALKKAATMFGIALELYRDDKESYFYEELHYEDPWNEEELEKHKENLEYLSDFRKRYNLDDTGMNAYINAYSAGSLPTIDYVMPDNIEGFVNYLKSLDASQPVA